MKSFEIPQQYRSQIISQIKSARKSEDPRKQDFTPTELDFGPIRFLIARHFGFCYGVENAIEIAHETIDENPGKRIFLLSEMIHNPIVNADLKERGINFIMDTYGSQLIHWNEITSSDVVIIPAFGTTLETERLLTEKGIDIVKYNTTCPFVEKVWNRAAALGKDKFTVVIHGKAKHEETRATFSHTINNAPSVIVRNFEEAQFLCEVILGVRDKKEFYSFFEGKYSPAFDVDKDLVKIGVVNQTTMLAGETQAIANMLRETLIKKYGENNLSQHYADTRDTLCYATNDNQSATMALTQEKADLAIVIGGYNSSNTSHLVELLEDKFPTYFVSGADKIISKEELTHFDIHTRKEIYKKKFLPENEQVTIAITSGASCPDSIVDAVLNKLLSFYDEKINLAEALSRK
ncbi:MAG: 4-hydroxy-3-methylbut-2-enyl diphosphate reductase [Stygiobacter sp. RIFOXYC12_FULL_38_8]|nr:MAG: 4-hydroxy-3-methylbut-2-enyl diphosphate reductase [Stygiobacter sp. RIFOXYA12_FULL_38_9]OGV07667.1 MAG: 4-hydroxy-3-methylbut-2-enyl diphosphate reductase [Stygiobacter sp. RIFOXYB2_FULL_37_11]OGV10829.1 MAG: 4-hydroxy-3-methylbut-2-enyl diphosphate reductase [Stygiobacter sp. RIFOXYA2_FULL_38_8]OGV12670.1 MAG: 4-hydroxy-3-methylbut-2-enyl diphosphate reductase [Stygiobacter sp. RIFOXYC2_FULL_38_25]OGV26928.1 MAG: 4-hydroxy-3-methylbut-2-enyl diphosphate reductase [Stygiobacter sp. RIF